MQSPIPLPVLRELRCAHCRKFVTCGPVHVVPDSSVLCGRCHRFAKRTYRNLAFEAAASVFFYPCHYWPEHCNEKLQFGDSLDHEKNCLYQSSCRVLCSEPGAFFKASRKLPLTGGVNLEHVPEHVLELLKCTACENYLSNEPVFIVADGKSICHRCVHSNGYPKNAVRNLAYERIAAALIFPCIYRFRGCTIRMKFGREIWNHEHECPYGQVNKRLSKKPSKATKERGVIETHSGHIWGTITPHSALFAPPKDNKNEGEIVRQELVQVMKKKYKEDEAKSFDSQSVDSVASTFDSADNISRSTADNISRDNVSRDNVSRDNVSRDNVSRDNVSRSSSRPSIRGEQHRYEEAYRPSTSGYNPRPSMYKREDEVSPSPTPPGYNKVPHNGYYQDNVFKYPHMYQDIHYSASFNQPSAPPLSPVKRAESARIGNQSIIDELRVRQKSKQVKKEDNPFGQCNNLQDLVHLHDQFDN